MLIRSVVAEQPWHFSPVGSRKQYTARIRSNSKELMNDRTRSPSCRHLVGVELLCGFLQSSATEACQDVRAFPFRISFGRRRSPSCGQFPCHRGWVRGLKTELWSPGRQTALLSSLRVIRPIRSVLPHFTAFFFRIMGWQESHLTRKAVPTKRTSSRDSKLQKNISEAFRCILHHR